MVICRFLTAVFPSVHLQGEYSQTRTDRVGQRPEHAVQEELCSRFDHRNRQQRPRARVQLQHRTGPGVRDDRRGHQRPPIAGHGQRPRGKRRRVLSNHIG